MAKTMTQKILARTAKQSEVKPGDIVWVEPDLMIGHDLNYPIYRRLFQSLGIPRIANPEKLLLTIDHRPLTDSPKVAADLELMRKDARQLGIRWFFDVGRNGISHILPVSKGIVRPGMLVLTSDTRSPALGAVGALGIALGGGFMVPLATGRCWLRIPQTILVNIEGQRPKGVFSRDIGQWVAGQIGAEKGDYRVIEFCGGAVEAMGVDERHTICNSMVDIGVKSAITEPNEKILDFVKACSPEPFELVRSDAGADYEERLSFDISGLEPQICVPPNPESARPIGDLMGKPITQAFVGSCISGKMEDMRAAARILAGRKVHPKVRLFIVPGTQDIYHQSLREGLIEIFVKAEAMVTPAACSLCYGSMSPLNEGDVLLSTGTRNEPGRMGSPQATIYLASAATVAASAVQGEITDPRKFL